MGSSIGCVRPPREGDLGAPTLSPKKRLRFRRKHKGRKNRKRELEQEGVEQQRSQEPHEREVGDEDEEEKAAVIESADLSKSARTLKTVPDTELTHSKTHLHSNTLSPGSVSASFGGRLNNRILESSPKPSPAWRGVFCLPGEEDTVSAIIDVSSIPSQTTTTTPVYTAPTLGSTTPGGGRVCRVKEKVQGVLEKPWILRQKKEKKDKGKVDSVEKKDRRAKGGPEKTEAVVRTPSGREHKGVVHIREVDGKLCVVRTVYPSDFGSPVWSGVSDSEVEVRKEPLAPSPVTGNILKVQLSEEEKSKGNIFAGDFTMSSNQMWIQDTLTVKGFSLHPQVQEHCSLLESGYSSDLPVTSPETAGTTPSQTDWGGLTSSSSERLDSMLESPLQQATVKYLPQISEIYVSGESADLTAKEKLLLWSKQATEGYPGLRCTNFTTSWSDGRMFNALLHRYRPDLIDMEVVSRQSNLENLEQAFEIAESLGVTSLLDAEDVDVPSPDEKSVITYVSSIYDAFPKIPEGGEGITAHWSRQHTAIMANKNFPQNPVELKALYNEYVHFKETEIPAKEVEKGHIEHLYKLLEVWIEFGRIKLPQGLHPNDLEEEWGKLILEMLEREKALRPAVERLEHLLQRANKIQNMALDCEEKLTLARNTLQADMSRVESGEGVQCERELACYLQDCESLIRQLNQELKVLREEKYYQVEQLVFRASCLQEELVSLRLQCSSLYRKGNFTQSLGPTGAEQQRASDGGLTLGQTLLGAVGAVGAALLRRPIARSQLVAMSSSEDEGSLRFIYELLGWVEETQELLERAEWGADLPSVENNLQEHNTIHTAVEELMSSLQEAKVSPNFKSSYSETLAKLEHQYCKLLEHSSWRLRSLESLHAFVSHCTEELIWLNEREEEEIAFDWSDNNSNMNAKRELYSEMRLELDEKQDVMRSLQETANRLCQENHPAKQSVEAYSAALQTQWQWVKQLCVCVETHLKDNTAYFQFTSDARDCESYLRQLQETIKRQYTCDKNSRLSKLEDLLQDSMEEKEQLIEYRSTVASLVGRAKTLVQLRPRNAESTLGATTPIRAVCDYRQIEITITRGEECVLEDNSQRTKWKVISTTGNEAMVPSVCFTVPPPNQEAMDTASRAEQLYQKVMSLWHQLHVNMKSVVSWHYLLKDIRTVSGWNLDTVRCQSPSERQQVLDHLESQMSDFLSDSKESILFTAGERRELEKEVQQAQTHCQDLLLNMETVEKDESVSRSYLSELQNITLRLNDAEQKLMRGIQTPPPSRLSGDCGDNTVQIAEQENLQSELDAMRSSLGDVSRRCISFFEEKPTSSSIPVLRAELNQAVEKTDRLHNLSSVYLEKLKTVEVLMRSLDEAESQVRKNESRLSEEDIVPADTTAIKNLREQLGKWQSNLVDQEGVFQSLQSEVACAKEAASQLSKLHPDRSPELERLQERANQMADRWSGVKRQMDTRRTDLESVGSALQQYRDGHSALINWIEETTKRQENTQPGQTDSKALSEQLAQQTALVAEIEQNQTKLDECQTHSKQYCTSVKDYELQLMTYRAFVESTQKSPVKRRRMHSSSDAITHEFMDLRTRYTALVTLTTQHVKYISDALRRIEEEEKEVEEEKQARVGQVSDLLGFVKGLQGRTGGPNAESSLAAQQAISEQLAAKKDEVAEAIRSTQVFLLSKQASKLSPEECAHEERKNQSAIAGVIDLGTVETFPVFKAAQRGLIDQDTCHVLLEAQLIMGGLLKPDSPLNLSLEQGLAQGLIDTHYRQSLSELETALLLVGNTKSTDDRTQIVLPVATAIEFGLIREDVGLRILELQLNTGGLRNSVGDLMSLEQADEKRLLTSRTLSKLQSRQHNKELIDPNTAEQLNLNELQQRCVCDDHPGLLLLPVKQQPGGTVCLQTGRKVGIFRAVQEGLIDRKVTVRLLEAQLLAGGISDPRSGHRMTIDEAVRHGLMDQDLACAMLARQLQNGGILDPYNGERLSLEESIHRDLLSPRLALLVLESLWAFMGILRPESGEILPIVEAIQQGVISGELSRNILRKRHAIGALYNPENLKVLPLNQAAEEALEPSVVSFLKDIHIPDVLSSMNQSGTPSLNRLSWGSTSSSPPPSSPTPSTSPSGVYLETALKHGMNPEEHAKQKLLLHLMTHSYVDAHSGNRLVLLDPELVELVKATQLVAGDSVYESTVKPQSTLTTDETGKLQMESKFSSADKGGSLKHAEFQEGSSDVVKNEKAVIISTGSLEERYNGKNDNELLHKPPVVDGSGLAATNEKPVDKNAKVKAQKKEVSDHEALMASAKNIKGPNELEAMVFKPRDTDGQKTSTPSTVARKTATEPLKTLKEQIQPGAKTNEDVKPKQSDYDKDIKYSHTESEGIKLNITIPKKATDSKHAKEFDKDSAWEMEGEDAELAKLVLQLKQGGLMTEEGEKLLPDEAVAQGVLPGHTAVKLMAQAGLFGGFLDASSCESLSMDDVMQEGLLDEDLMWSVLKSDKTLSGVVDVEKRQICGVSEAAQVGLIDPNTAARLLEAQVVSGGIVDLRRDKKVSVTLAAKLGLIEEGQREELVALEKAYKGKDSDSTKTLTKASLQLQMEGIIDPESKSPVPLEQAIQKGLIRSEDVYQVLARQVAEGGVIHHASGVRLSIPDAVDRGLVDRSIAPGLEELEWVYQGKVSPSSHPEAVLFQASTGAILDPESGCKLTLTEAVSMGLLDENIASETMASPAVAQGVLDPETARIMPYSELVKQGKIDIETGKRFLEVKPFRGVPDEETGDSLTLPEAVASKKVDPVPALRLLQSQADSGGIIDIRTGDRLPLYEACERGLIEDSMVRTIATNQFLKGGLVDPATGQRVSSLNEAIAKRLIPNDVASEIQERLASFALKGNEGSDTPITSSSGAYSPAVILSVSSPDSPANWLSINTEGPSKSKFSKQGLGITEDNGKTFTSVVPDQSLLNQPSTEEGKVPVSVEEAASIEPDQSIDLLCKFATNVEKRIQEAIEEIVPQTNIKQSKPLPNQKSMQIGASETRDKQKENVFRDSFETIQAHDRDIDKNSRAEVIKGAAVSKSDGEPVKVGGKKSRPNDESTSMINRDSEDGNLAAEVRDNRESKDVIEVSTLSEEDYRKSGVAIKRDEVVDKKVKQVEKDKPVDMECSPDAEQSDQLTSPSKDTESKSKKKRKNKKNGKGKEAERETHAQEIKQSSQIHQDDAHIQGRPEAAEIVSDKLATQDKCEKSKIHGPSDSTGPSDVESESKIGEKIESEKDLVKQEQESVPATQQLTENTIEAEKDTLKKTLSKGAEKADMKEESKREGQKENVENRVSVSQQPEQPESNQEVKKGKEQELPQKSTLPNNEKAALLMKAKESILKKVFEKGVSEKQAAEELQALRKEVGSQGKTVKSPAQPTKADLVESHGVRDDGVKRTNGSPNESAEEKMITEDKTVENIFGKENTQLCEASSTKGEEGSSFGDGDTNTAPSVQSKETLQSKRRKKNKKSKIPKGTEADTEKVLPDEKVDSEVTQTTTKSAMAISDLDYLTAEQGMDKQTDSQSASDLTRPSVGDEANEVRTSVIHGKAAQTSQHSPTYLCKSEELNPNIEEQTQSAGVTSIGKEESQSETNIAGKSIDIAQKAVACKPDIQPPSQSVVLGTQPDKTVGKSRKKRRHQPPGVDGSNVPESNTLKEQQQHLESKESAPSLSEDTSTESESLGVPESDSASESWGEGEHDVSEIREIVAKKEGATSMTGKSSLIRQECLEHDQQIVALVSMVRHIEVRLKQQQQQSVGRSLIALDDIITQTETLDLELRDLEPAVTKQVEAAEELLKPRPKDVPPQLLLALEKDGRSLARGYEAARALSEGILQSLRDHRNSYKEAVTAEQKSLGGRVENLLSWLRETEAQMSGGMAGMDKMETAEKEDHSDQLTQQLHLCKASSVRSEELQASLTARSSEVNSTAFDIQVFISERAQDLAPEQSRQLLGQLQQLQRAFHLASGQAQVVQQQKAECSQKLEGLTMWLAGAASLLVGQKGGAESGDVNVLKEKQKKLKESQKDLQAKGEAVAEAIRSVEELLADRGESLSPEERKNLQGALTRLKEQYSTLKDSADTSLSELDTAISTTVQQNTQRAKAEEDLQETQGQIDSLLKELSSLNQPGGRGVGSGDMPDTSFSKPEGAVMSHTEMLQNELQQLQAQQAQLLQITQSTRALLDQPDSTVPPEEKQRLRAALDQLQAQHQERLQSCQDRLRKSESLKDELTKFLQEHGGLGTWLEQNEQELRSLGEGETDAQGLKGRLEEHRKLAEDVICHKADLRFVSISGQKVLDSVQGALEQVGGSDPALDSTKQLVTDKLQDANHRYTSLHTKSTELGGRLSGLLERYQQYQDEVVSLHSWLSTQEQNQSIAKPSGDTDPKNLQDTLRQVQLLQDELAEHSVQLEKVKRAGRDLVSTEESPSLKAVDILCAADGLEKRFGSLSASVSERAEQLQTAVAQSVSVQEGLTALLGWLDKLPLTPGPVEPTAQALQDALTQNQKLRQELLSRQGSVEATRDSISKLLQSSDASTASGLLLPRLESYERLGADLQVFTQSRLKALSPGGQPERSVDDYRQTIEEVKSELEQEAGQLKSFCNLGTDLSQSKAFNNTQSLLDNVKGVSDEFTQLEANVNQ
ncbi:Microtubule-actin cross-linking factor 1 isoforms 1/2/3/5, partial [Dissostichus eleginoides]